MAMIFKRIVSWWKLRRLKGAVRMAADWECWATELSRRLGRDMQELLNVRQQLEEEQQQCERKLQLLRRRLDSIVATTVEDLNEATSLQEQQKTVVEALQQENQVMSEATIPMLVASNRLAVERWNAQVAAQVRQQVLTSGRSEE
jgi:hypothetical protein